MSILSNQNFSFYLKISLMALAFSIAILFAKVKFASENFLLFGLATFLYGIIGHITDTFLNIAFGEKLKGLTVFLEFILFVGWLIIIVGIVSKIIPS
jgi:hypothetical protein